jgi:DNA-binding response OmpR family regulator
MNGYVSKPYHPEILYAAIDELLRGKILSDEGASDRVLFSLNRLYEMYDGNKTHVKKTAEVFIRQMRLDLDVMTEKLRQREFKDIQALLHKMGPGVELFQITDLLEMFAGIREDALQRDASNIEVKMERVIKTMEKVREGLEREMGSQLEEGPK